jgi:hypothetical protein
MGPFELPPEAVGNLEGLAESLSLPGHDLLLVGHGPGSAYTQPAGENSRPGPPRRDDAWVRPAARFYRALRQCRGEAARQGLARRLLLALASLTPGDGGPGGGAWERAGG